MLKCGLTLYKTKTWEKIRALVFKPWKMLKRGISLLSTRIREKTFLRFNILSVENTKTWKCFDVVKNTYLKENISVYNIHIKNKESLLASLRILISHIHENMDPKT